MFKSVYQVTAVPVHFGPGSCHHGTHNQLHHVHGSSSSWADNETSGTQSVVSYPTHGTCFWVNHAYTGVLYCGRFSR